MDDFRRNAEARRNDTGAQPTRYGGQIRVPLIWPAFVPSKYGKLYAYGQVIERERHLIVSGGLGTSVIPARFGVPPEIVHVTLSA